MSTTTANRIARNGQTEQQAVATQEQPSIKTAISFQLSIIQAIAELVRDSNGGRSEGEIYAMLMPVAPQITADYFASCVGVLVRAGVVKRAQGYLTWSA